MKITKFEAVSENENYKYGGSKICEICGGMDGDGEALVYGQLQKLFGKPVFESENFEEWYNYYIKATDENGKEYYLEAYFGPTGSAVGGSGDDEETVEAANALVKYIKSAETVDYEAKSVYEDFDVEVIMGVKNGTPYSSEREL